MFGESLLVCPVTEPMYFEKGSRELQRSKGWECYLPMGTDWYDFYTGEKYSGGGTVLVEMCIRDRYRKAARLSRMRTRR